MIVFAIVVLLVSALFNLVAWPRFYPRIAADARAHDADGRPTAFLRVHVTLIVIALFLALAAIIAAIGLIVVH